jgi:magnesium chelatase subunit I
MTKPRTVGELRQSGHAPRSVKTEIRQNLIRKLERGERIFPGIVGYDETVLPKIENALLSGQDLILLGERGQAKSRLARALVALLDDVVPALAGSEVNDDPLQPISKAGRALLAELGDRAPVEWLPRERRYGEKLATPDITIADLIGEVDPIKVAEGRYLSDELTIHYGLLPRTHRGIFVLNELPDLAERIQVGLLNIMEERDVQIRGYLVRLPLDLLVVASANPEDYTNRGRIITPLKDRFGSQVRTHYPRTLADELGIVDQEATRFPEDGYKVDVPAYMREIVAELTHLARRSPEISQRSGVSVRVSITNYENLVSNALRRAVRLREAVVVPRVSDLGATLASTAGKIELETAGDGDEGKVVERLTQKAVLTVFNRHFQVGAFGELLEAFGRGLSLEVGEGMAAAEYERQAAHAAGLGAAMAKLGAAGHPARVAAAVEFVLEGLHLNKKLNKDRGTGGGPRYRMA